MISRSRAFVRAAVADQEPDVREPLVEVEGEVACLLHGSAFFGSGAGSEPGMIAGDVMPGRSQAEGRPTRRLFTVDLVG